MAFEAVSAASIVCISATLLVCFALPIVLPIVLYKKLRAKVPFFFWGCACFVVFALILEAIFHQLILSTALGAGIQGNIWSYALYGGLAAGIFEELGRFAVLSFLVKRGAEPQDALMFGAGHGGIEALLVIGLAYVNNLIYALLINAGMGEFLLFGLDEATTALVVGVFTELSATPPAIFLAAGFERIVTVAFHIAATVIVFYGVKKKRFGYVLLAVALHALLDAMALLVMNFAGIVVCEVALVVFVAVLCLYAARLYKRMKNDNLQPLVASV